MDITIEFRECVHNLTEENKVINDITAFDRRSDKSSKPLSLKSEDLNSLKLKKTKAENGESFSTKICDIINAITKMRDFLVNHRKDYINIYSSLLSHASSMTDNERDQIDADVYKFMKICNNLIKSLRTDLNRKKTSQLTQHQHSVIDIIENYLKVVCNIHSEQRAIRVKRAFEKQRMMRLENFIGNKNNCDNYNQKRKLSDDLNENISLKNLPFNMKSDISLADNDNNQTLVLSSDELQVFEQENEMLYQEMNSMVDDVKQIEGKVIEIARLQEIFTEKVLQQEQDLNRVNETVIASTENIRGGNEQVREAMKKNAGFRVWVLFFIITLAFTILFLDWYNP